MDLYIACLWRKSLLSNWLTTKIQDTQGNYSREHCTVAQLPDLEVIYYFPFP